MLSQTEEDFEYIIVDDNPSSDASELVVKSFSDKRIRYIRNDENPAKTHCRPFNVALKMSKGDYIAYLDDDNEFYPYHLEILLNSLKNNDADVAYCDMMIEDEKGTQQAGIALDFDAQFLLNRNFIDTSEIMHNREVAFAIGGWDEKVTRFTDWNFCVRAMKWGARFKRVPIIALRYHTHSGDTQSSRTPVESWYDPAVHMRMFKPTFPPAACYIHRPFLEERPSEAKPKVAIFTLTYGRLDYTKRMWKSMCESAEYPFDWFVFDQGSDDGTGDWLFDVAKPRYVHLNGSNVGITKGSNHLLDKIREVGGYQIIIKVDNDCEFMTKHWLETLVDLWKRNHMLYMSPYVEGLIGNPGGAPRVGHSNIGPYPVEVTKHIGGICAFIDASAYENFRWTDQFKHGNQDSEASFAFRRLGYMPCYIPVHRVMHMDGTDGQLKKYENYFKKRIKEKTEVAE